MVGPLAFPLLLQEPGHERSGKGADQQVTAMNAVTRGSDVVLGRANG
jgi:hypothetical protein